MNGARARLLGLLNARVLDLTEAHMTGLAACGMLCAGGSERRGCDCPGPKECKMKTHPAYEHYIKYRAGQMNTNWFTAPEAGKTVLIRSSYDAFTGEYVFDTETVE